MLCFKREFPETDALKIWESCWSHYQTDYFHLFICVAIVSIYGDDVIDQGLPSDEILLHFSSLAMHMNGQLVLRKVGFSTFSKKLGCYIDMRVVLGNRRHFISAQKLTIKFHPNFQLIGFVLCFALTFKHLNISTSF